MMAASINRADVIRTEHSPLVLRGDPKGACINSQCSGEPIIATGRTGILQVCSKPQGTCEQVGRIGTLSALDTKGKKQKKTKNMGGPAHAEDAGFLMLL
jgi:hypothetical protein